MENTVRTDILKEQVDSQIKVVWETGGTNFFTGRCEFHSEDRMWVVIARNKTTYLSSDSVRYIEVEQKGDSIW